MITIKGVPITKTEAGHLGTIYSAVVTIGAKVRVGDVCPDDEKIRSTLEFILRRKLYSEIKVAVERLEAAARIHAGLSFASRDEVVNLAAEVYNLMEK